MTNEQAKARIDKLRQELTYHSKRYYEEDAPEISDFEYDALFRELCDLEAEHPEYDDPTSPTKRVGGLALDKFEKFTHRVPLGSLSDVFSFDELHILFIGHPRVTYTANDRGKTSCFLREHITHKEIFFYL